jgi:primosomal protein N'
MPEEAPKYICQECGRVQDGPAPCESCAGPSVVQIAGPSRAKAIMPSARPL